MESFELETSPKQPKPSSTIYEPITAAAVLIAQSGLILRQASMRSLTDRDAVHLRSIADGLLQLVPTLQRIGRGTSSEPAI